MQKISVHSLSALLVIGISVFSTAIVLAHTSIPTAPTTSCGSLDSLDLGTHVANQIDSRLVGKASSTDWTLFTTRGTGSGTTYVRNTGVWTNGGASPIDWTGISPYNTSGGYHTPGTLISPRHVLMAAHYAATVGAKMYFVDNNNVVYERTLSAAQNVPSVYDVQIGVLDSDLPDSVMYYPIISSETLKTLLTKFVNQTANVPIISFDQEKKAIVKSLYSLHHGSEIFHKTYRTGVSGTSHEHYVGDRSTFSEDVVSGDSGNPNFILIDGQPVLLGDHYGSNWFYNPGYDISAVNAVMTSLGGGYQLTEYTPETCFTNYAPQNNVPAFNVLNYNMLTANQFNLSTTTVLRTYSVQDADVSQTHVYSLETLTSRLTSGSLVPTDYFAINSSSGALTQKSSINTNVYGQTFDLAVRVLDDGTYPASSTVTHVVTIYDSDGSVTISPASEYVSTSTNQTSIRGMHIPSNGNIFLAPNSAGLSFRELPSLALSSGNIVKIGSDGLINTTFLSNQGNGASSTVTNGIVVSDIYEDSEGDLVLSGIFSHFNNATSSGIARLNADGTTDTAFASNTGSGLAAGTVLRSLPFGNKIMSLGTFNGTTFNENSVTRLMMLNSDGTFDTNFSTAVGTSLSALNTSSFDFIKYNDTQAVVASNFTSFNGTSVGRIARINTDGTLDTAFNTAIGTGFKV